MNPLLRGVATPKLRYAVLGHWLYAPLYAWLVASPVLSALAPQVQGLRDPEAALLADGSVRLVEFISRSLEATPGRFWLSAALFAGGALVSMLPNALLCVANTQHTGHSWRRATSALPRFCVLLLLACACLTVLAVAALIGVLVCELLLPTPTDERARDVLCMAFVAPLFLGAFALQPITDLARLALVRDTDSALTAFIRACQIMRRKLWSVLTAWLGCMGLGWALFLCAAIFCRSFTAEDERWARLLIEQLALLGVSWARATWLSYAVPLLGENTGQVR